MAKCNQCGMLTIYDSASHQFVELDRNYRADATKNGLLGKMHESPICFLSAHDLYKEALNSRDTPDPRRSLAIITKERDCDSFCQWKQGFTPKEHVTLNMENQRREQDQAFQEKMIGKQGEILNAVTTTYAKQLRKTEKMKWWMSLGSMLVGAAVAIILNWYFGINLRGDTQPPR